jgi:hypothetical protein
MFNMTMTFLSWFNCHTEEDVVSSDFISDPAFSTPKLVRPLVQ